MNETGKRIPELRVEGFIDDWEQRTLSTLMDFSNGINAPKENYGKGRKMISVMDILSKEPISYDNIRNSVEVDSKTESNNKVENGDIVFVRSSEVRNEVGWAKAYLENEFALYSGFTIRGKKIFDFDAFFVELSINGKNREQIESKAGGSTRFNVSQSILKSVVISEPSLVEQKKISAFFKQLDDTIALHLCKQQQFESLKKSMIKEILPQNDSVLPRLRFANFNKPWEQHQLKEVLKINSGRDYKHLNEGNIPVYGTGGYMLSVDGKLSDVDGIGLGRKGTIDKPQYLKAPFWTVDTLFYLTPFPNYDIYFLFTLTQSINWKTMDESTGVPSLSKAVIEKVTRTFPSFEEQKKIGSFFKQLDETISHHQQKIDNMKSLKRALLNKMFI